MKRGKPPIDPFESRLASVPLRSLPDDWRREILARAGACGDAAGGVGAVAGFWQVVRGLLWPHPAAWGALAMAWLCAGVLQCSSAGELARGGAAEGFARTWLAQQRAAATLLLADPGESPLESGTPKGSASTNRSV